MKGFKSTAIFVLAAVAGGLILAFWFSQSTFQVAGTTVEAKIFPSKQGVTQISIPPVGEIRAYTHGLPLGIGISIAKITITQVRRLASPDFSQDELIKQAEVELADAGRRFAVRLLVLATLGGLCAGLILPGRNWRRALVAALIGFTAVAVPGLAVAKSYDLKAWRQPKYTGMLATAPWLLGTLEEKLNDLDAFRAELRNLAKNLHEFYSKVDGWEPIKLGNGAIRVLHVSDIHNNPAAMDLIAQVVKDFHVDMIIDTGDLTDLGTPMEASMASRVGSLGVPYVFVPGNHDSDAVLSALRSQANVRIVDGGMVEAGGLKIFGDAEPAAYQLDAKPATGAKLTEFTDQVAAEYRALPAKPDVVAIHSFRQARQLVGRAPLILVGHDHESSLRFIKGTIIDDAGTTGAAGIRTFEVKEGVPYSLKLLYFSKRTKQVMAVDSLALSGVSRDFMLERKLIAGAKDTLPTSPPSASLNLSWRR